jgi:hypothetical protein
MEVEAELPLAALVLAEVEAVPPLPADVLAVPAPELLLLEPADPELLPSSPPLQAERSEAPARTRARSRPRFTGRDMTPRYHGDRPVGSSLRDVQSSAGMPPASRIWTLVVVSLAACARDRETVAPEPEPANAPAPAPEEESRFVSTDHSHAPPRGRVVTDDPPAPLVGYEVTTAEAARERAEAAVQDRLDPSRSWRTSPVFPTAWPPREPVVMFFFYPMAASETEISRFTLYSAAFRVDVSLRDGSTNVRALGKPRRLANIEEKRAATLERGELEIAERTLLRRIAGVGAHEGENGYWGYLKYFHEHPQLARDLRARVPAFAAWLQRKG